jgi:hypothetical protein
MKQSGVGSESFRGGEALRFTSFIQKGIDMSLTHFIQNEN